MKQSKRQLATRAVLLLTLTILCGCETISALKDARAPAAKVTGVRVSEANFQSARLLFDIELENPNPIHLNLQGISYGLKINDHPFFNGNLDKSSRLKASGASTITTPVEIQFADLLASIHSLKGKDVFDYEFESGFEIALPGFGTTTIPVRYAGEFPILRPPAIKSIHVKQQSLNFTGAELKLSLAIHNPNAFAFDLKGFDYRFQVNQSTWAKGKITESISIQGQEEGMIEIPISLNFLKLGTSIYRLLTSDQKADYNLEGNMNLQSTLPFLKRLDLPFVSEGSFSLE